MWMFAEDSLIFSQRESGIRHKKLWCDYVFLSDMI